MSREILINFIKGKPSIAIVKERLLDEIFLPQSAQDNILGNIYLGQVENVLPGMQAAFVDIGLIKNSFLYVEDVLQPGHGSAENATDIDIATLLKPKQNILVQVFKEPSGSKGARVTMYPSLPGRYLVLLPKNDYLAISRKIIDEQRREELKEQVQALLPLGMGAIIRTVAEAAPKEEIAADLAGLLQTWQQILQQAQAAKPIQLLHSDFDLLKKVIRDTNPADISRIIVGNERDYQEVAAAIDAVAPSLSSKIKLQESKDIFLDYNIYSQIEHATKRKIWLKSGGYLVFDQTEALMVIDVNTGKYIGEKDLQATVLTTNIEAVSEIARQLRLRNIGGIIIIDFIDMDNEADKQILLEKLEQETAYDRIRTTVMGITQLGLVELTRKKSGHSLAVALQNNSDD